MSRLKPGYRLVPLMEDFGVPMTKIPETIRQIQAIGEKHGFPIATFGHIGDGNLHATFIMDVKKSDEWEAVKKIVLEFVELTAAMEGTMSAEHGLGMAKAPVIVKELGATGLEVMQTIKDAMDPKGVLNPGKLGLRGSIEDVYDTSGFEPCACKRARSTPSARWTTRSWPASSAASAAWAAPPTPRPTWSP